MPVHGHARPSTYTFSAYAWADEVHCARVWVQVRNVLNDMRGSLDVRDRRKGLLRSYKSCFLGKAVCTVLYGCACLCLCMYERVSVRLCVYVCALVRHRDLLVASGPNIGRDAVTWLCENAVEGHMLTRRQALQLARELLEMGGVQQADERAHGFRDDATLYRFATDAATTPRKP
jgi:hypothetical protein